MKTQTQVTLGMRSPARRHAPQSRSWSWILRFYYPNVVISPTPPGGDSGPPPANPPPSVPPAGAVGVGDGGPTNVGVEVLVGIAGAAPVSIENPCTQEVVLQLRPVEITDPPIVSFLPLLFHEC